MSRLPEQDEPDDAWRDGPRDPWDTPEGPRDEEPDAGRDDNLPPKRPTGSPPDRLASVSGLMASVSTAYTAAHGHPLAHDGLVTRQATRRRWSVGIRAAVVASLALAVVTGVVVVRDLARTSGAPVPLAEVDPTAGQGSSDRGSADAQEDTAPRGTGDGAAGDSTGGGDLAGAMPDDNSTGAATGPVGAVAVHVVGQVTSPGVVEVAAGSRVIDAITAAGGLTEAADSGAVNLARPVVDGEQIYVPVPGETPPAQVPVAELPSGSASTAPGTGTSGATPAAGAAINLNTADVAALDTLPGVGPAIAGRIVDWREAHGGFATVDDLLEVSGIGPAVLAKIRDLVTV